MLKKFIVAVALASTMTLAAAPSADAGPFRDLLRGAASKVANLGVSGLFCAGDLARGQTRMCHPGARLFPTPFK